MLFNRFWHSAHFRNAQGHVAWLYIFLVFMSVVGIWPIFEMHRCMWPGYTFSRFHECFWHSAHFRNAQGHVAWLYIFLVFMSVVGILPIFEMHRCMWSGHIFSRFCGRPQKRYQSEF